METRGESVFVATVFGHSLKTYGWVYPVVAAELIVFAFLVLSGWQLGFPYPIWSLTCIALGALVIDARAAYGGNAEAA